MYLGYSEGSVVFLCACCGSTRVVDLRESTHAIYCFHGQSMNEWKSGPSRMVAMQFKQATEVELEEYEGLRPKHFVGLEGMHG